MNYLYIFNLKNKIKSFLLVSTIFSCLISCTSKEPAPVEFRITPILKQALEDNKNLGNVNLYWIVKPGETLTSISINLSISIDDLVLANKLSKPDQLFIGQKLIIPRVTFFRDEKKKSFNNSADLNKVTEQSKQESTFVWPAKGLLLSKFGKNSDGLVNDGINISLPLGSPIFATAEGEVIFVGSNVRGFGNLLMLRHRKDWISAYAHTEKILVNEGEIVKQGDQIALAGASGLVKKSQLHFELRKGTSPVDPLRMLSSRSNM